MFLSIPLVVIFHMLGGQINKLYRPIGCTLSMVICFYLFPHREWFLSLPILFYAFRLTLGDGPNSKLMKVLKSEQKVRIVEGLLSSIPVLVEIMFSHNYLVFLFIPLIVASYCIRLGRWGHIGKFDILPVDIFRGLAIAVGNSLAVM